MRKNIPNDLRLWLVHVKHGKLKVVADESQISSAILSMLREGHKDTLSPEQLTSLEKVRERFPDLSTNSGMSDATVASGQKPGSIINAPVQLHSEYPDQFDIDLANALHLRVMGTSLRRLETRRDAIAEVVERGGTAQVLFVDTANPSLCKYVALQDVGRPDIAALKRRIQDNAEWWLELKHKTRNDFSSRVEIRKIDYAITFGLDIFKFANDDGSIYHREYPFVMGADKSKREDRPIKEIRHPNFWHKHYVDQFDCHWDSPLTSPWEPISQPDLRTGLLSSRARRQSAKNARIHKPRRRTGQAQDARLPAPEQRPLERR